MRSKFVDIDGIRTRYLHEGAGKALFMLHGVGISGDCFIRNIDPLAERFAVYAPDMLGHGFTDAVDYRGGPPQPHIVRHLGKLADRLGLERYSVAGSSFGALIAALMYFDRPERVESLILIGSGSTFHPAEEQRLTLEAAFENGSRAMVDPTLSSCRQRMANICHDPASVAEEMLLVQLTYYGLPDRFDAYRATISGLIGSVGSDEHRVYSRLERIKAPTLIVTGRQDIRAQIALHEEGCRRMPDARLVIFERCGHLPFLEYPQRFNQLATDFLANTGEALLARASQSG